MTTLPASNPMQTKTANRKGKSLPFARLIPHHQKVTYAVHRRTAIRLLQSETVDIRHCCDGRDHVVAIGPKAKEPVQTFEDTFVILTCSVCKQPFMPSNLRPN